ncbi:hypothetical protein PsYK624_112380 [Phanerochaete sordida]|uniref:Fungal-type protein kinase domain-containing protein n=1 Tax=Phanerochaete sordida TaxID=48140 RepID=A0A9P3GKA4_9APHY|nr:hypothetical protein PsYK624_112380 [Phanerochaete sordida]
MKLPTISYTPSGSRHRVIYTEAGQPIFRTKSLRRAFRCIRHIIRELDILHGHGFVHGDVNYSNFLLFGKKGKIADLDYAKKEADKPEHFIRAEGTYFVSEEVHEGGYLYTPMEPYDRPSVPLSDIDFHADDSDDDSNDEFRHNIDVAAAEPSLEAEDASNGVGEHCSNSSSQEEAIYEGQAEQLDEEIPDPVTGDRAQKAPFQRNALHDLESVLWLSFYLILAPVFKPLSKIPSEVALQHRAQQKWVFHKLFSEHYTRSIIMIRGGTGRGHLFAALEPTIASIAQQLLTIRDYLITAFSKAEAHMTPDHPISSSAGREATARMSLQILRIIKHTLAKRDIKILAGDRPHRSTLSQEEARSGRQITAFTSADQIGVETF